MKIHVNNKTVTGCVTFEVCSKSAVYTLSLSTVFDRPEMKVFLGLTDVTAKLLDRDSVAPTAQNIAEAVAQIEAL